MNDVESANVNVDYGNPVAAKIISMALKSQRVSHAYLFRGPRGSPKEKMALDLAKGLLCDSNEARERACNLCWSCRQADKGSHPDLFHVEREGNNIKLRRSHEILKEALSKPYRSSRKVFVIKDAETLTVEASNALLKILEEPPSYVTFIITSGNVAAIPETIVSRCQMIPFRHLPSDYFRAVAGKEETGGQFVLSQLMECSPAELAGKYSKKDPGARSEALRGLQMFLGEKMREAVSGETHGHVPLKAWCQALESTFSARRRLDANTNAFLTFCVLFVDLREKLFPYVSSA